MRVRVSGMVWLPKKEADQRLIKSLRSELTIQPRKMGNYGGDDAPREPIRCYAENAAEFGVPRAFWFGKAKGSYDYRWDLSMGTSISIESKLRHTGTHAEQQVCIDKFVSRVRRASSIDASSPSEVGLGLGGILQAGTGFGKTATALGIIAELSVTTLILVHKEFLQRQWVERIRKFLPDAKVGLVREKTCDFAGKDIVVAMMQSLSMASEDPSRYPRELYDWPGLIVADECHRVGAPTWAPIPTMFPAAFRLGLTATPRRKDGADSVFWWHIGDIFYKAEKVMPKPHVRIIAVPKDSENTPAIVRRKGISPSVVTNILVKLRKRNQRVVKEIVSALDAPSGRKIMVLSERLEHLRRLEKSVKAMRPDATTSFYVGEWFTGDKSQVLRPKQWEMDEAGRKKAILTIYRSLSRRKWTSPDGEPISGGEIDGDEHRVMVYGRTVNAIRGLVGSDAYDDDEPVLVTLESMSDDELFQLAREFKIAQKAKEKKRVLSEEELFEAEKARVIFATFQMVSEGIDLPAVDTLVLASPVSDVEQAVGRARRECVPVKNGGSKTPEDCRHFCEWRADGCEGKPVPIVADIVDLGIPMAERRSDYRERFYRKSGFKVAGRA